MGAQQDQVADAIRTEFLAQKALVFKRKTRLDSRWDNWGLWNKAAVRCIELGADPERYVQAIFEGSPNPKMLFPNMLSGGMAERCWSAANSMPIADILTTELKNNYASLKQLTGSDQIDNYYDHVKAHWFPMLSYMRLLMFPMDPILLERYGIEAWEFLSSRPAHVKVLDQWGFRYNEFTEYMTNGRRQ